MLPIVDGRAVAVDRQVAVDDAVVVVGLAGAGRKAVMDDEVAAERRRPVEGKVVAGGNPAASKAAAGVEQIAGGVQEVVVRQLPVEQPVAALIADCKGAQASADPRHEEVFDGDTLQKIAVTCFSGL